VPPQAQIRQGRDAEGEGDRHADADDSATRTTKNTMRLPNPIAGSPARRSRRRRQSSLQKCPTNELHRRLLPSLSGRHRSDAVTYSDCNGLNANSFLSNTGSRRYRPPPASGVAWHTPQPTFFGFPPNRRDLLSLEALRQPNCSAAAAVTPYGNEAAWAPKQQSPNNHHQFES
jgi:hypothetical protein